MSSFFTARAVQASRSRVLRHEAYDPAPGHVFFMVRTIPKIPELVRRMRLTEVHQYSPVLFNVERSQPLDLLHWKGF